MSNPAEVTLSQPHRVERAILVVDVVESVRLIEEDELGFVDAWRHFVVESRDEVLPAHRARMVKHLGDGMLVDAETAHDAVAVAFALFDRLAAVEARTAGPPRIQLRAGMHQSSVLVAEFDIFGAGVNLAARLATLARPGELVASAAASATLLTGVDVEKEDLGEFYFKHLPEPVRAYRLRRPGSMPSAPAPASPPGWSVPKLVVMPLAWAEGSAETTGLCASVTDDLVCAMGRASSWAVVSRLSTAALAGRHLTLAQVGKICGARYVVGGRIAPSGAGLRAHVEVHDIGLAELLWEGDFDGGLDRLFGEHERSLVSRIVRAACAAIQQRELSWTHEAAFPNLPSYALLLKAVSLLHSLHRPDVAQSRLALEHLVDRHPRVPEGRAWLANWHFMQVAQASTEDRASDIGRARSELARALEQQPEHAMALALEGHLHAFVDGELPAAERLLRQATACGPNEAVAWLFLANVLTHADHGLEAVQAVERARALSPLDPMAYNFDLFAARAYSATGQHEVALRHTEAALRLNRLHLSTWVQLIIEQVHTHRMEDARASARSYLSMRPNASVSRYFDRHPARGSGLARSDADALRLAGLPA